MASISEATLLNIGPVVGGIISDVSADPGYFPNALVVSRIPVFLFQGVKASLLPALTTHATNRNLVAVRADLQKMALVLGTGTLFFAAFFGRFAWSIRQELHHLRRVDA